MHEPFATWLRRAAILAVLAAGCKGNFPDMAPVEGMVTYQGKALTHGQVVFTPAEKTPGPQAIGEIQADGTFRMETLGRTGAAVGQHVATVHCRAKLTPEESKNLVIPKSLIPESYGKEASTPFRIEVKPGMNACPLELKD